MSCERPSVEGDEPPPASEVDGGRTSIVDSVIPELM